MWIRSGNLKQQAVLGSKAYVGSDSRRSDRLQDVRRSMMTGLKPTVGRCSMGEVLAMRDVNMAAECASRNMQEMVALAVSTCQ